MNPPPSPRTPDGQACDRLGLVQRVVSPGAPLDRKWVGAPAPASRAPQTWAQSGTDSLHPASTVPGGAPAGCAAPEALGARAQRSMLAPAAALVAAIAVAASAVLLTGLHWRPTRSFGSSAGTMAPTQISASVPPIPAPVPTEVALPVALPAAVQAVVTSPRAAQPQPSRHAPGRAGPSRVAAPPAASAAGGQARPAAPPCPSAEAALGLCGAPAPRSLGTSDRKSSS
jgi:hypothetical protein